MYQTSGSRQVPSYGCLRAQSGDRERAASLTRSIIARQRFRAIFASLVAVLAACGGSVEGEMFIVTQGGDNVRLGGRNLSFIPEREALARARDYFRTRGESPAEAKLRHMRTLPNADVFTSNIARFSRATAQDQERHDAAIQLFRAAPGLSVQQNLMLLDTTWQRYHILLREEPSAARVQEEVLRTVSIAGITTQSDADGKFWVKLPRGRFAVHATASRLVGNSSEDYRWIVWVEVPRHERLLLTNSNLSDTDNPTDALRDLLKARETR